MTTRLVCARYNENINWLLPLANDLITIYNKGEDDLYLFSQEKVIKLKNFGREAGTYVHHIVTNYDNLEDYTIFIQGNPVDHIDINDHQRAHQIVFNSFNENKTYAFQYLSAHFIPCNKDEILLWESGIPFLGVFIPPISTQIVIDKILNFTQLPHESGNDIPTLVEELKSYSDIIFLNNLMNIIAKYKTFVCSPGDYLRLCELQSLFDCSILKNMIGSNYEFGYGAMFVAHKSMIQKYPKRFWQNIYNDLQSIKAASAWGLEKLWRVILSDEYTDIYIPTIEELNTVPLTYNLEEILMKKVEEPETESVTLECQLEPLNAPEEFEEEFELPGPQFL